MLDLTIEETPDRAKSFSEYNPRKHKFTNIIDDVIMSQGDQESMETNEDDLEKS